MFAYISQNALLDISMIASCSCAELVQLDLTLT
jgi:hypothetical protein